MHQRNRSSLAFTARNSEVEDYVDAAPKPISLSQSGSLSLLQGKRQFSNVKHLARDTNDDYVHLPSSLNLGYTGNQLHALRQQQQ